jgi:NodT family efflux transporter outer membrane factor (OMF) lipoprotein
LAHDIPVVPVGIPTALLERRPDIASAERQMASANAQIGVETAAWFPNLTLSASYGYTGQVLSRLIQAPNSIWSFGPALAETIFDGGLRAARVEAARALYDEAVANYRQTVLAGFQQVEDQLATLRILEQQAVIEKQVVADSHKTEQLVLNQYKAGTVPYSSVLTAQTTTLSNEQTALSVRQARFIASVALIESLGGGWDVSQLANDNQPVKPDAEAQSTKSATNVNINK